MAGPASMPDLIAEAQTTEERFLRQIFVRDQMSEWTKHPLVMARADGVEFVTGLRMAAGEGAETERIALSGLELPRVLGVLCAPGDPPGLNAVRGIGGPPSGPPPMPIPALPEDC